MADLTTTVHSPHGPILAIHGRVPKGQAVDEVRRSLERDILRAQDHLREIDNWFTTSERGYKPVKTHEELNGG